MHFSINGRQSYSVIKKADEIKFNYNDKDKILDLIENYSDKIIVLDVPGAESDWTTWKMYSEKFAGFHIALHDLGRAKEFNQNDIKWYWPYPITSFYELGMLVNLHPSYLLIGQSLTFDLATVAKCSIDDCTQTAIPLRMTVNVAHPSYLPTLGAHGVCGQWVRPEDLDTYAQYIDTFEFGEVNLSQEETLLKIYSENRNWPGNLNLIIKKLDFNVDNRALPEEIGKVRTSCKHRCWKDNSCHYCISAFKFAENIRKRKEEQNQ